MLTTLRHYPVSGTDPRSADLPGPYPVGQRAPRWEDLPGRFFHDLTDLPSLASFAGAQPLYQLTRAGLLRGLGNAGPAARLLAALGGLMVEAPAVVGLQRGVAQLAAAKEKSAGPLAVDLAQTYRTLIAFRFFGSTAGLLMGGRNLPAGFAAAVSLSSMYGGIFSANIWNRWAAGEKSLNFSDLARESLVTLAQLKATGHVLKPLSVGRSFEGMEHPFSGVNFFPKLFRRPAFAGMPQDFNAEPYLDKANTSGIWFSKGASSMSGARKIKAETINNGPLGEFVLAMVDGVPVFTPLVPPPKTRGKGLFLLISGLSTDHTRLGEVPRMLAMEGWRVRVLVYPGFENLADSSSLKKFRPEDLARHWQKSIEKVSKKIIKTQDSSGEIYIGGYSMGGVGAVASAYGALPPILQRRVSGLILAAPAFHAAYFETPSKFRNWFGRRVFVPFNAFLGREYRKVSEYHSDLGPYLQSAYRRPWSVDYAAVLYCENGKELARRYKGQPDLPPVLLIHTGAGDPVVSPKSADFIKEVFGEHRVREVLLPADNGHYPLVGMDRSIAQERILEFISK